MYYVQNMLFGKKTNIKYDSIFSLMNMHRVIKSWITMHLTCIINYENLSSFKFNLDNIFDFTINV